MDFSLLPFFVCFGLAIAVGFFFSRSKKSGDYFLGNRSLGWFLLMMTFVATQVGGGFILGTAEAAFEHGLFGIFYSLGQALGFLALGLGFGARLQSLKLNTASDLFETYYGSRSLKKYAALLSIVSLTGILIAQAVALKKFLYSLGFQGAYSDLLFYSTWMAVLWYTTQGGFLAVVWTDLIQASLMIGILVIAFFFTLSEPTVTVELVQTVDFDATKLVGLLIMPFMFMFIEQDMVQRCFAGRSSRDVTIAALLAALVLFALAFIPVYFGMLATQAPLRESLSSKFMVAIQQNTNAFITSATASAVLLAIIATSSSLLSAISSNIVNDFSVVARLAEKNSSFSRLITLSTGLVALIASHFSANIFTWMIASYELAVDALFVPLVMAVFYKERCQKLLPSAKLATLFGSLGFIETHLFYHGLFGLFLPLLLSLLGYAVGRLRQKELSQA